MLSLIERRGILSTASEGSIRLRRPGGGEPRRPLVVAGKKGAVPATAAAALAAAAVKSRGEDDVALLEGEVGLVRLDRRRGFVGHDVGHLERNEGLGRPTRQKMGAITKKRARGWGNHGPRSGYRSEGLWGGTAAEEKHLDGGAGCRMALATSRL